VEARLPIEQLLDILCGMKEIFVVDDGIAPTKVIDKGSPTLNESGISWIMAVLLAGGAITFKFIPVCST